MLAKVCSAAVNGIEANLVEGLANDDYTQRQKSRRVRARGLQRRVGRVPSRGAKTYDALYGGTQK
jgi:hypothetical protein